MGMVNDCYDYTNRKQPHGDALFRLFDVSTAWIMKQELC